MKKMLPLLALLFAASPGCKKDNGPSKNCSVDILGTWNFHSECGETDLAAFNMTANT